MTKQEALDMVLKMLSDGEILVKHSDGQCSMTTAIMSGLGNYIVRTIVPHGVSLPRSLQLYELEWIDDKNSSILSVSREGIESFTVYEAIEKFNDFTIFYRDWSTAEEAVKILQLH